MESAQECDDRLAGADISLEKSLHTVLIFHVFEDLKKSNFLVICQSKRKPRYPCFDLIGIELDCCCMSFAFILDSDLAKHGIVLYLPEFFIGKFLFGTTKILMRKWEMKREDILVTWTKSFFLHNFRWKCFWERFDVFSKKWYLATQPFGSDSLYIRIERIECLTIDRKWLDLRLCKTQLTVLIFWLSFDDDLLSYLDLREHPWGTKKNTFT